VAAVQRADRQVLPDYQEHFADIPLLPRLPSPGWVVATKEQPEQDLTEWTLGNGARVVVKQTDFSSGEIRLVAFAPGGHSLAADADFHSAVFADEVAASGGLGCFDAAALRKRLAGTSTSITPVIDESEQRLYGRTQPADLETLMQLIYLSFTAPRRDPAAFTAWRERTRERLRRRQFDPEDQFEDAVQALLAQGQRRRQPLTADTLDDVELDRALAFYRQRFADAANFTFVLVGNLDAEQLQPLVERYLASLPSTGAHEKGRDLGGDFPPGIVKRTFALGQEDKSRFLVLFHGSQAWSEAADNDLETLRVGLQLRLHDLLRETLGGVYSVSVAAHLNRWRGQYALSIEFACAPAKLDELQKALWAELAAIRAHGLGEPYLSRVIQLRRRVHERELHGNTFWQHKLISALKVGEPWSLDTDIEPWVTRTARPRVQSVAARYLNSRQYVLTVTRPAGGAGGSSPAAQRPTHGR
jgi:zinc protease